MPQPLRYPERLREIEMGGIVLRQRPDHAALIAQVIAVNAEIDIEWGHILGGFLGTKGRIALQMYLAILTGGAARMALRAAAEIALGSRPEDWDLFSKVWSASQPVRDRRNELAHCQWAVSPQAPEFLLWIPVKAALLHEWTSREAEEISEQTREWAEIPFVPPETRTFSLSDLEGDLKQALIVRHAVGRLSLILHPDTTSEEWPSLREALRLSALLKDRKSSA